MHTRRAPELHFTHDNTLQHAMHIERLLQEARATRADDDGSAGDVADAAGDVASPTGEATAPTGSDAVGEDEHGRD
jgi:hypothetical protein